MKNLIFAVLLLASFSVKAALIVYPVYVNEDWLNNNTSTSNFSYPDKFWLMSGAFYYPEGYTQEISTHVSNGFSFFVNDITRIKFSTISKNLPENMSFTSSVYSELTGDLSETIEAGDFIIFLALPGVTYHISTSKTLFDTSIQVGSMIEVLAMPIPAAWLLLFPALTGFVAYRIKLKH
tara:strand:- start:2261 stop:2797 length:537 start_codon:yes stop_codon:yes gene_type:complete